MSINFPFTDANGFFAFGSGSNLRTGSNPPYAVSDFLSFYPQFGTDSSGNYIVPETVIQNFVNMASASIQQTRWRSWWTFGMATFIAHFCTLYLETMADPNSGAAAVFEAGRAQGVVSNEDVGDVSYSADVNIGAVDGWANWNSTSFGRQFAARARIVGKGGMYVW